MPADSIREIDFKIGRAIIGAGVYIGVHDEAGHGDIGAEVSKDVEALVNIIA